MFKSSRINLAKANIATNCVHNDRLPDPFFASFFGVVVVGGFGLSIFAESWTVGSYFRLRSNLIQGPVEPKSHTTWVRVALMPVELTPWNAVPEALPLGIRPVNNECESRRNHAASSQITSKRNSPRQEELWVDRRVWECRDWAHSR